MSSQQYQLSVNMENIGLLILAVAELASFHSLWKATKKQIESTYSFYHFRLHFRPNQILFRCCESRNSLCLCAYSIH